MYRFGIFGKPNVGKSSLFNTIIRQDKSIIAKERGVTRDRINGILREQEKFLILSDLPGMERKKNSDFKDYIHQYLVKELARVDVLIVVFDIQDINPEDKLIYQAVRKFKTPHLFIANKVDTAKEELLLGELYTLGSENFILTSAKTKKNLDSLKKELFSLQNSLIEKKAPPKSQNILANDCTGSFAILGKTNVGKSSFLNCLLGEERSLVKEERGTTRDAVDDFFFLGKKKYKLIDTAGLRKKNTKKKLVENLSIKKTFHALEQAEVIIFIIDCLEVKELFYEISEQDKKLISLINRRGKSLIIYFNKWDLIKDISWSDFSKEMKKMYPALKNFRIAPLSCKKILEQTKALNKVFKTMVEVLNSHQIKIKTTLLNNALKMALEQYFTDLTRKNVLKIYYATQIKSAPPLFHLYINQKKYVKKALIDYFTHFLSDYFNLVGTPLNLKFFEKERKTL